MIMKDETGVILRCLNSVFPIINHYTIIDTGSTDESKDIVRKFFEGKNIQGEIYDFKCKPEDEGYLMFDEWRTFAVEKAKGKTDYCFTLDADEVLAMPSGFNINNLKSQLVKIDIGLIDIHYNNDIYGRRAFWKNSKPFYYFCPVHELLMCDTSTSESTIKGLSVKVSADGNSWNQNLKDKYLAHAKSLLRHIEKNGDEPRAIFYLAQSYKDAGETEKALEWYEKRAIITSGYVEEQYWSQFMVAELKWALMRPVSEVADEYMKCFEYDDLRAEHIPQLKHLYERCNRPKSALKIDELRRKYIGKNPYPERGLFINPDAYKAYVAPVKKTLEDLFNSIPSAWIGHREFASWLVNEVNPKFIVDLGVDWGYSTFSLAAPNIGRVYGIDTFEGDALTGIRNTYNDVLGNVKWLKDKHKISNIQIMKGRFDDVATKWNPQNKIDILHIDGVPSEIQNDYDKWFPLMSDDGIMLFHDTQSFDEVKKFFSELPLHKMEFKHSGGLGVASRSKEVIEAIKNKYYPPVPRQPITIAYISHNEEVFKKYLKPSLGNLKGEFDILSISNDSMPAEKYNKMLELSKNKYVLFLHEDTTFSPDFIDKINKVISTKSNFGAIGAVGNYENNIQWSKQDSIIEVKTLDCCCILVNKEHKIKFDDKTFDEFHLYVDDYCMQVASRGLKCYTIPINASEAEKDDEYKSEGSYFKHHSYTVNKLGYCWGKYWEYKSKMDEKWKKALIGFDDSNLNAPEGIQGNKRVAEYEVDVCIISNAKTDGLKKVTEKGIETLLRSEENIIFHIYVVESNKDISYDNYPCTKTLYTNLPFGYNSYLNLAIREGKSEYVVLCNSDLTYEKNWAINIINEMKNNPLMLSASPFCPQTQNKMNFHNEIQYGHTVRRELAGWCIFQQRKIYDIIGRLDEGVDFWFSDNIYADQLIFNEIKHALIVNSIVNHHEHNLGATGDTLDANKKNEYTTGQHEKYLRARDKLLNSNKTLDFYS